MPDSTTTQTPVVLPGVRNLRDLGGIPTSSGKRVVPGRLYRAELLREVEDADRAPFERLGLKTIIDLRGEAEAGLAPSAWARVAGAESALTFPIDDGGEGTARDYVGMLISGEMARFTADDLAAHYVAVLEARARTFAAAVAAIADGAPALVHCTEGKDRTGLLIALVLDLLGVPRGAIVADYVKSDEANPDRAASYGPRFASSGVALEDYRPLYESPALAMAAALHHLHQEYGGAVGYLTRRGGIAPEVIESLRATLLEG